MEGCARDGTYATRVHCARLETRTEELPRAASRAAPRQGEAKAPERGVVDPKGGDLYVATAKPCESLVEAGSDVDVQITRASCVKGRKTHRTPK